MAQRSTSLPELKRPQTVFIHKLYDMLHDELIRLLIWWLDSGDLFCLVSNELFLKVLSLYFKHTNIALFIRQLNMYGFHKVNDNDRTGNVWEFRHSAGQFKKGDIDSLRFIKRRSLKNISKEVVLDDDYFGLHPQPQPTAPYPPHHNNNLGGGHVPSGTGAAATGHVPHPPPPPPPPPPQDAIPLDKYLLLLHNFNNVKFELLNLLNKFDYFLADYRLQQQNTIKLIELLQANNPADLNQFKHYLIDSLNHSVILNNNFSSNSLLGVQHYQLNPHYTADDKDSHFRAPSIYPDDKEVQLRPPNFLSNSAPTGIPQFKTSFPPPAPGPTPPGQGLHALPPPYLLQLLVAPTLDPNSLLHRPLRLYSPLSTEKRSPSPNSVVLPGVSALKRKLSDT